MSVLRRKKLNCFNSVKNRIFIYLLAVTGVFVMGAYEANAQSAKTVDLEHLVYTVEDAPDWTTLFKRNMGWFGADGIYAIPMDGGEEKSPKANSTNLFLFSDSMIGQITDDKLQPGYKMIHNSVAIFKGNEPVKSSITFYWNKNKDGNAESVFVPKTPNTAANDYFWLGDGFMNTAKKAIYIFGYRVRNVSSGAFGFAEVGNVIINIPAGDMPSFTQVKQMDSPLYLTDGKSDIGSFGAGIYVNTKQAGAPKPDGYVYVYGVRGMAKQMMVARVKPKDFEDFTKWTFWDGAAWTSDMAKAAYVTNSVSNELSLTALPDGRYALIFQYGGMSPTVGMRIGASPVGPFGPVIKLWDCSSVLTKKSIIVYNAKAHPSISKPGELLVSFNVNSLEFDKDLNNFDPHLYRPRFFRIKFGQQTKK